MYRTPAILIVLSLILSACAPSSPSIWGVPQTPTPDISSSDSLPIDPFALQDNQIIFPTSTIPPSIETENAYTPTPTITPNSSTPVIEPTYTLSYDAAPFLYYAQSGDMLSAVASRFGVDASEITSDKHLADGPLHHRLLKAYYAAIPYVKGDLLEICCGEGRGIELLSPLVNSYTAIDKISEIEDGIRQKYPKIQFLNMNVPPFTGVADNSFDTIVTFQVI